MICLRKMYVFLVKTKNQCEKAFVKLSECKNLSLSITIYHNIYRAI